MLVDLIKAIRINKRKKSNKTKERGRIKFNYVTFSFLLLSCSLILAMKQWYGEGSYWPSKIHTFKSLNSLQMQVQGYVEPNTNGIIFIFYFFLLKKENKRKWKPTRFLLCFNFFFNKKKKKEKFFLILKKGFKTIY